MPQPVGPVTVEALAVERQRIERIAHNLANLHTPAFRPAGLAVSSSSFDAAVRRSGASSETYPHAAAHDGFSPGALRATGRALDIALAGEGYLEVATPEGPAYTRRGDLRVQPDGRLVDHLGHAVVGRGGEIVLAGHSPRIDSAGRIRDVSGATEREVGRLRVVAIPADQLRPVGQGFFASTGPVSELEETMVDVRQGFLEASKVDVAREMVVLARSVRHFETVVRVIQARGEVTGSAIRMVGSGQ